jgi:CHAD domain-containing protein
MEINPLSTDFIDQRWEKYRSALKASRAEFTETTIHDLRVSTRKLLAALEFVRSLSPRPVFKKLRRKLKNQLDGFDKLRDVQVMLADIASNNEILHELAPLHEYLKKREKRLLRAAEKHVQSIKKKNFGKRHLRKVRKPLDEMSAEDLTPQLLKAVDNAYLTVKQRYGEMDPSRPATIHHVRVAFKKFRYMVECVQPALPNFPEANLKSMQDYQTMMGDIHDKEVFLDTLADFAARHKQFDPEPIRRFYEQSLAQVLSVYLAQKDELDAFWHATLETDFPWASKTSNQEPV